MKAESHFWLTWWVSVGTGLATLGAVLVALFGDWIKAKLFAPKLTLAVPNVFGERTSQTLEWETPQGRQSRVEDARYYHLRVVNAARWPTANQTQVYIQRVEEPGPDGQLIITWSGDIPIQWTHQALYPLARTIGPEASCDLCSVVKGKWLQLHPMLVPNNFLFKWREPATIDVTLRAKSNEAESPTARIRIAWDGKWEDGTSEMAHHLVVKNVSGET